MKWWQEVNKIEDAEIRGKITDLIECYCNHGYGSKEAINLENTINDVKVKNTAIKLYNKIQCIKAS